MFSSGARELMHGQEIFRTGNLTQLARPTDRVGLTARQVLEHCARTAVAAVSSLLVARLFGLPEIYWAPVTTLVITQSSLGSTLAISWQRFVGTVLGAVVGAILVSYFGAHIVVFGISVFILGLLCALAQTDRNAYRFGSVTLTIVMLVPMTEPAWRVAFHRSAGVSLGIAVALVMTVVWPESEAKIKKLHSLHWKVRFRHRSPNART